MSVVTGNYTYETGSMTGILEQLTRESLKKRRKDIRLIMLYKGLKGAANRLTNNLVLQTGVPGIIIPWHFKPHWLELIFINPVSSPRLKETGTPKQMPLSMLLSVKKIQLLRLLLLSGLGTSSCNHCPGECVWPVNNSDFDNFRECELILQDGFDPNQLGPDGVSPMHLAAGLGIKAVCLLLQFGGNPNIRSADGTTPTHVASIWGEPDCLQILLANGGDPFLEDQDGSNALDLARRYKHPEIIQVVEQYMTLLSQPTEETITPKYTYTRRSTGSSASVRSESPELSDTTLDTSAYDTQRLHEYLREFTKRRRSSMYLRDVQSQVNKYFGDGQRTHLVDVTSPDHPYVETRGGRTQYNSVTNSVEGVTGHTNQNTHALSPVEESLHLHLSTSEDELSTSCDSYFTCDGEDLDTIRHKSLLDKSFDEDNSEDTEQLLNTVIKNTKFMKDKPLDKKVDCDMNQSNQHELYHDRVSKPVRSRGDKYCRRMPLFIAPETQDLITVQCDLCGKNVSENYNQVGKDIICDSCERLSQELDDLLIDRSEQEKTAKVPKATSNLNNDKYTESRKEYTYEKVSKDRKSTNEMKKEHAEDNVLRDKSITANKNNSHQNIDEMIYKLRQSSLHRNPKINVHNIPYNGKTQDRKNDSLISSDDSFIHLKDGFVKAEFYPSDISTITVEEGDLDTVQNEAFIGFPDKGATSTSAFSSRGQSDLNYPLTKATFHDADLSTITEVDSADITRSNIFTDKYSYSSREQDKPESTKQDQNNSGNRKEVNSILIQDSSPDFVDLWDEVRAKTMKSKTILDTGFIGRESLNSYASDATTVEYVYTDPENGIALIERHIPSVCGSVGSRRSLDSQFSLNSQTSTDHNSVDSQDTQIYDWREEAMCEGFGVQSEITTPKKSSIKPNLKKLDNNTIRSRLCNLGDDPGPVTNTTRQTYLTRLSQLENDPEAKIITKKSPEYPSELRCALQGNLDFSNMAAEEEKMFAAFQNPKRDHRWREGTLKSSFNYILLDPRITKNLPNRACNMSDLDVFQCFISAIFYVGKGKRARPYSHLYEAIKQMQKPKDKVSNKVTQILDIWSSGLGVVSLHCFQSVIPVEAYTREACIVDAIGLHKLTNMKRGDYYGISVTYSMKQRRKMGVYLLTKALQIFLAEGERQISPLDIKTDCVCQPP